MKITVIEATKREKAGKGAARAIRRGGMIPAVVYGDKQPPVLISIPEKVVVAEYKKAGLWTREFEIVVGKDKYLALCQDIQKHPVSDRPLHVDFLRISKNAQLTLDIPLHFINEDVCPGVKMGGVLNVVHRSLQVKCSASSIPEFFEVDLSKEEAGHSILASEIKLPQGVSLTATEDFTVATIVSATTDTESAAPATAETEDAAK